jgi:Cdc6-like AAA superfamily ATPase
MGGFSDQDWSVKEQEVIELFTPSVPIDENDLFAGRSKEIGELVEAVLQKGQHAILYGERGVGKTSLARTFSVKLIRPTKTLSCVIVNCVPNDTFQSLWLKVYADLSDGSSADLGATQGQITPDSVRRTLSGFDLTTTPIIIFDEFDKLVDAEAKALLANTIKALSDYAVSTTIILVGVAKSVSELIGGHESILRALAQIPMPRMNTTELGEVLDKRLPRVGMTIAPQAKAQIVTLSRGLPHYTHLLGQFAAKRAIAQHSLKIAESHVDQAERDCLTRTHQTTLEQYQKAIRSHRAGNIYKEVLLGCALAEPDALGFFPAKAVEFPLTKIMKQSYDVAKFGQHLKILCEPDRGSILEVTGTPRRFRYRFVEPLMQPYVLLQGLSDGLIDKSMLEALSPNPLQPKLSSEL